MATFRKRGTTWRAEVCVNNTRTSKTFDTKRAAEEWARRIETSMTDAAAAGVVPCTLREALTRYKETIAPTHKGYRWEAVRIERFMKEEPQMVAREMHTITTPDLVGWKERRLKVVQPVSVRRDIALLSVVWKHARRDWHNVRDNPWRDLIKPANGRARDRIYTHVEIDLILKALDWSETEPIDTPRREVAAAFLLALETAMRSQELVSLTPDQIRFQESIVQLEDSKNGDRRAVPLSNRAMTIFSRLLDAHGDRVFRINNALRDVYFRKARDLAGVDGVTFHDSRATALTRLSKKLDVLALAKMVGHRDPRSLMTYYRESATDIASKLN